MAFSNMWVRTAVGLTFAPFIVILAWTGGFFLFLFVTLVALIGLREYYGMAGAKTLSPNHPLGYAAVLAICLDAWRNRGTDFSIILADRKSVV